MAQAAREEVRRRTLPAWGLSVALHCAIFLLLGVVLKGAPKSLPSPTSADRLVGIVLAPRETSGAREVFQKGAAQDAASGSAAANDATRADPTVAADPAEPPLLADVSLPGRSDASLADANFRELVAQPGLRTSRARPQILPGLGDDEILA